MSVKYRIYNSSQKVQIMAYRTQLLQQAATPPGGIVAAVQKRFPMSKKQYHKILNTFNKSGNFSRKSGSGRPRKFTSLMDTDLKKQTQEAHYKGSYRGITAKFNKNKEDHERVSMPTLYRHIKHNGWRVVKRQTKPLLTPGQVQARYEWCSKRVHERTKVTVDLDETWVFGLELSGGLKMPPGVEPPAEPIHNKRYIDKIMMLSAIAEPNEKHNFDGKVCFTRISETVEAKRRSQDHDRGDFYEKDCTMTAPKFLEMMKADVIPAISGKMSWAKKVWVQIDNAPPHVGKNGLQLLNDYCQDLTHPQVEFFTQPAKSPDLNANDLGFFNSIKKLIDSDYVGVLRKEEIYTKALEAFNEYSSDTLARIFRAKKYRIRQVYDEKGQFSKIKKTIKK